LDAQVNISCKPMLKGRVWQSDRHRDETHTENSCRDPFGSMREHLPKLVEGNNHDDNHKHGVHHFELMEKH
jgi:hypothetical protein